MTGGDAQNSFADADDIAPYAKEAVSYLNSIKIVNGDENGRFNPNGTATRAESAQMIYNIIEFMKTK
ncbi:MAG: S-layer homology domain-containing protein [Clostridiales bacterium]|nr:MAG: S-layer homology domain-containing protein [Clostridiales bacterium]